MVDEISLTKLLRLARQVHEEYRAFDSRECETLARRCNRLERQLSKSDVDQSSSGFLWIDEVHTALTSALEVADRFRHFQYQPQPSGVRAIFAKFTQQQPRPQIDREIEAIRKCSNVINEWLSAYASLQKQHVDDDDDNTAGFLGDSIPPLLKQYTPCHINAYDALKGALVALLSPEGAPRDAPWLLSVRGPRGVGKTVLVTALLNDEDIAAHYGERTLWVQLGEDCSEEDICEEIANLVDIVIGGGFAASVRSEFSMRAICHRAVTHLSSSPVLVVVDDVCSALGENALKSVMQIVSDDSVVIVTSPNELDTDSVLSNPRSRVLCTDVEPFPSTSPESAEVFSKWLYNQPQEQLDSDVRISTYKETILTACSGLPLALAMAAGSVSKSVDAWERVATALIASNSASDVGSTNPGNADSPVTVLLDELLSRGDHRFGSQMRSLVALPKGLWISLRTLADLWGMDESSVKTSAKRLGRLAFGEYRLSDASEHSGVRLCWHVSHYCRKLVSDEDVIVAHRALLTRFAQREIILKDGRHGENPLWWESFARDRYLCRRLCWHMANARVPDEYQSLLTEYLWMASRLESSSVYGLRLDIHRFVEVAPKSVLKKNAKGIEAILHSLQQLSEESQGRVMDNNSLAPLLVFSIRSLGASDDISRNLMKSVCRDARRPWLKPVHELLYKNDRELVPKPNEKAAPPSGEVQSGLEYEESESDASVNYVGSTTSNALGYAIAGEANGRICVWDVMSGRQMALFDSKTTDSKQASLVGAVSSLGSDTVVSGHSDGVLRIWSISGNCEEHELRGHEERDVVTALAVYEPDTVVSGTISGAVFMWLNIFGLKSKKSAQIRRLGGHTDEITALHILPGGKRVISGSYDGFAAIWDANRPASDRISLNGHKDYVTRFASLQGGRRIVSTCRGGTVYIWNSSTGECVWSVTVGYEFGSSEALRAFASHNFSAPLTRPDFQFTAQVGFPYFCSRGENCRELVVLTSIGNNGIVARALFEGPISAWSEVWHPGSSRIYVVVAHSDGLLRTLELVTAL